MRTALAEPEPVHGGWRIGQIDGDYVEVLAQIFNYRLVIGDGTGYHAGWCYFGKDPQTLLRAITAAQAWILSGDDEPAGWNKNLQTRQYRETEEWG